MLNEMQADEKRFREIVEEGGGLYKGYWRSMGLVAFDNSFRSTLCLKPEDLTVEAVRVKIAASNKLFTK
jgi:hypothetical protein